MSMFNTRYSQYTKFRRKTGRCGKLATAVCNYDVMKDQVAVGTIFLFEYQEFHENFIKYHDNFPWVARCTTKIKNKFVLLSQRLKKLEEHFLENNAWTL